MIEIVGNILIPWAAKCQKKLAEKNTPKGLFSMFSKDTASSCVKRGEQGWELRFAADLALILQDYQNAIVNYKRLLDKIQKGNAYEEIGSCKEFLAIATLIVDGNKKEFKNNMEIAIQYYEKSKRYDLIARNGLYLADLLNCMGCYDEINDYITKIAHHAIEDELPCILYQQAALCHASNPSLSIRKCLQCLFNAGIWYAHRKFYENAIYCLNISYKFYVKSNWPGILICICIQLGNSLLAIKHFEEAFEYHKKALNVSIEWKVIEEHKRIFKLFIETAKILKESILSDSKLSESDKTKRIKEIIKMDTLIDIELKSVEIFTPQDQMYSNDPNRLFFGTYDMAKITYKKAYFEMTEEDLAQTTEGVPNNTQSWITLGKLIDADLNEPIEYSTDPVQIKREEKLRDLYFSDEKHPKRKALMYCNKKRIVHAFETIIIKFSCTNPLNSDLRITNMKILCHYADSILNENIENLEGQNTLITLRESDDREVLLRVIPKVEGELRIDGIEWEIAELINGSFKLSKITEIPTPITLLVRGKSGQLEIGANQNLMTRYLNEEIDSYTINLRNSGQLPITKICLQTDFPLLFGWKLINFDWILNPNEEKEYIINFHAQYIQGIKKNDPIIAKILIRYLGNSEDSEIPFYRYSRLEHFFYIYDSFAVSKYYIKDPINFGEYLLNLQIEKLHANSDSFSFNKLSVIGNGWKIKQKQRFTCYNKLSSNYISIIQSKDISVPLNEKQINYDEINEDKDITLIEPYVNFINEYKDELSNDYLGKVQTTTFNILATWTILLSKRELKGASIIPIMLNAVNERKINTSFPLQVLYEYDKKLNHDFEDDCICIIPFKLQLRNKSKRSVSFKFEAIRAQRDIRDKSANFVWQGETLKNIIGLNPNEEQELYLEACVMKPGVYDINKFVFIFYIDQNSGDYLDPSGVMPTGVSVRPYSLDSNQILVTVGNKIT